MKYIKLILVVAIGIIFSCNQEPKFIDRTVEEPTPARDVFKPLMEIVFSSDKNFQTLHKYYLETKENMQNEKHYSNLRTKIISHMSMGHDKLQDQSDLKVVEFYVNEILSMDYISDMGLLATLLEKLNGYWDNDKIISTAEYAYTRNMKYINENFVNPEKVLEYQNEGATKLRSVSQTTY